MKLVPDSIRSFTMAKSFPENGAKVNSLSFSADGERCLAASDDDSVSIYNVQDGTLKRKVYSKKYGVENVCFTKERNKCIYSSNKVNEDIRYQELEDIKYIRYYSGHLKKVVCLAMAPGPEDLFLSGSKDRTLRLWDLRSPHCQGLMKTQGTPIGAFDPEGLIFAAGIDNSTVKLYDLRTFDKGAFNSWQLPFERSADTEWTKLEFSKDGQQILITTNGDCVKLVDAYTGELTGELRSGNAKMTQACYTPDGSMVIAGDDSGGVTLYDAKRPQMIAKMDGKHPQAVTALAFNHKYMMMASACHQVCFWLPTIEE